MTASPVAILCRCGRFLQASRTLVQWELRCPSCGCGLARCEEVLLEEGEAAPEVGSEDVVGLLEPSGARGLAVGFVSLMWAAAFVIMLWSFVIWKEQRAEAAAMDGVVSATPEFEVIPLAPSVPIEQYSER